jgi:hypothetical protein
MLARVWSGPEATSVWVELVKERKLEIERKCEDGEAVDFGTLMATRQQISRNQLAEWDASARAWLRTADEFKKLEQTQLMLVIDNLDIPVNHDMRVYSSVMQAWKTALQSLERMVIGCLKVYTIMVQFFSAISMAYIPRSLDSQRRGGTKEFQQEGSTNQGRCSYNWPSDGKE